MSSQAASAAALSSAARICWIGLAEERITMVVVTHEMGFARRVADRVVFMADGQILEENTPEEFFRHPQHERAQQFLSKIAHAV